MNKSLLSLLLCFISFTAFSQFSTAQIVELEDKILNEKTDMTAVELITAEREARKAIYAYRLDMINSYDEDLSRAEKNKKFRKDSLGDEDYQDLIDEASKARKAELRYLNIDVDANKGKQRHGKKNK